MKNKKELVNCISTLHSLLENPPGDFPDNIRKEIVEGLLAIWSLVSDEGNISHKLIKCINTYLLKDGPNLDREYLESIHSAVHGFAFRSWPKIQNLGLKAYWGWIVSLHYCYHSLWLSKFVGVGEASFVSHVAPFIDDNAPVAQKTAWLAAFYMCIPGGIACGYVLGRLVASHFSWRWAFYGEAILIFSWAVLAFVIKTLSLKGFSDGKSIKGLTSGEVLPHEAEGKQASGVKADSLTRPDEYNGHTSKKTSLSNNEDKHLNLLLRYWKKFKGSRFYKDMKALFDKVYVVNVFGYVAYNFVIGAYSYWGPKAGYGIYHMDNADTLFGGITIICGIVGTLAGGFILDRMNSTIKNAFKLLSGATFLGAIFCFSAFTMKNVYGFFALFAVGELLVFATQAPVNFVCLHCVKPSLRPLSMAVSTICIHIFGDVPSSPLVGELQDQINNWRTTTLILTSILFLAAAIWFIGIFLDSADKFNEESNQKPLLEGNPIELPKSAVP